MLTIEKEEIKDNTNKTCITCSKGRKKAILLICYNCHKPLHYDTCGIWVQPDEVEEAYYFCKICAK